MIDHAYITKIKNGKPVTKDEKIDYINTLIFDSNKIILNNNDFNMTQFLKGFNEIIGDTKNLYVYLDFQVMNPMEETSEQHYKNIYNQSIKNISNIFGNDYIILHSSRLTKMKDKAYAIKTFLIYCENSSNNYNKNQNEIINKIELINNLLPWDFRALIALTHQMELYRALYSDLFNNIPTNRISNFLENTRTDKVYGVGIIKKTTKDKKGTGDKYTINSFKIEPEFKHYKEKITFKFNIITKVFVTKEKSASLSEVKIYNNQTVQMAILGEVDSIPNYYDKKSITFNVHDFDNSKFHFYCLGIDILKKNKFSSIIKGNIEKSFPILENEDFYKNNIQKKITIGLVFEEHLKNKIDEYIFYFNEMLINKSLWTNSDNVDIKHIQIEKNLDQKKLIDRLELANCDGFICLTDIDDYNEEKQITDDAAILNDYYKTIKNYSLNQNLENKKPFITQGLIVPNPQVNQDEHNITDEEVKQDNFKDKIKTAFYELCTKYIFYNNQIKLTSYFEENNYLIISFNAPSKLCSCIEIQVKDKNIEIVSKELLNISSKTGNDFKKDDKLINWLSKKIENPNNLLKEVSSYEDFIIYDLREKNFLLCSSNQTYLLSDNDYLLRKELILKHRTGKTYERKNKQKEIVVKESIAIMSLLMPLYNVSKTMPSQIFLFEINNEQYYFVGNEMKKTLEHPQSPLVKMYFNEENKNLLELYFSVITANVVRNGLNTKTTLFEKFSKLHMVN